MDKIGNLDRPTNTDRLDLPFDAHIISYIECTYIFIYIHPYEIYVNNNVNPGIIFVHSGEVTKKELKLFYTAFMDAGRLGDRALDEQTEQVT